MKRYGDENIEKSTIVLLDEEFCKTKNISG